MRTLDDFARLLGRPPRDADAAAFGELFDQWGVRPPSDFLEVMAAYGDCEIGEFLIVYGANDLAKADTFFGPYLHDWETSEDSVPLLPIPDGMILWAHTYESDQLCLRQRGNGRWTVSVSLRNFFEWRHSGKDFSDWLYDALCGESETDWLPEWTSRPLKLKDISSEPSGW